MTLELWIAVVALVTSVGSMIVSLVSAKRSEFWSKREERVAAWPERWSQFMKMMELAVLAHNVLSKRLANADATLEVKKLDKQIEDAAETSFSLPILFGEEVAARAQQIRRCAHNARSSKSRAECEAVQKEIEHAGDQLYRSVRGVLDLSPKGAPKLGLPNFG